jgi:hypothetical protein
VVQVTAKRILHRPESATSTKEEKLEVEVVARGQQPP